MGKDKENNMEGQTSISNNSWSSRVTLTYPSGRRVSCPFVQLL